MQLLDNIPTSLRAVDPGELQAKIDDNKPDGYRLPAHLQLSNSHHVFWCLLQHCFKNCCQNLWSFLLCEIVSYKTQNPACRSKKLRHILLISSLFICSERPMALANAMVCLVVLALIHILPFIPTAISKDIPLPRVFRRTHSGFKSLFKPKINSSQLTVLCWCDREASLLADVVQGYCEEETIGWQNSQSYILTQRVDTDQLWLHIYTGYEHFGKHQVPDLSKVEMFFLRLRLLRH